MNNLAKCRILPGIPSPLGATVRGPGVNFAIFSRHAHRVWLALFNAVDDAAPAREVELTPERHRVDDVWNVFIEDLRPGAAYLYRIDGPRDPKQGHRFDASLYLLDPYAKLIVGDIPARKAKCVVADDAAFLERRPTQPRVPMHETIIYETHVRGLTMHESSGVEPRGAYRAVIEKIPYLRDLGVTAVELLPVQECGETELTRRNPITGGPLTNYWGYNPIGLFAPMGRYGAQGGRGEQLEEFRRMVDALHEAGLEVILDVVFNHTVEGNVKGPTLSFRGIDNAAYYVLDDKGGYFDATGCGNTVNCNHPVVSDLIIDCLRYWVTAMGVDGFRFDEAVILNRDPEGNLLENGLLVERIREDPVLCEVKLIAEAWDAIGGYQVGSFGLGRWADWNRQFRDDVRRFWRGDAGLKRSFALRLMGSPDLYREHGRAPVNSINYVTCHDGFTLRDLVSYKRRHNKANGENNRDGPTHTFSWNCGVEGDTEDPAINALRLRMQKNFLATLFLSLGVPMLLGGDEFGRTQGGNNNAYCHDNAVSWYDWTLLEKDAELHRYCKDLISFRKDNPVFARTSYPKDVPDQQENSADAAWFDAAGNPQRWAAGDPSLAYLTDGRENNGVSLYMMFNTSQEPVTFRVPAGAWRRRIYTAERAPDDITDTENSPELEGDAEIVLEGKSLQVLSSHS